MMRILMRPPLLLDFESFPRRDAHHPHEKSHDQQQTPTVHVVPRLSTRPLCLSLGYYHPLASCNTTATRRKSQSKLSSSDHKCATMTTTCFVFHSVFRTKTSRNTHCSDWYCSQTDPKDHVLPPKLSIRHGTALNSLKLECSAGHQAHTLLMASFDSIVESSKSFTAWPC